MALANDNDVNKTFPSARRDRYTGQGYPQHLRRIRFCDPDTNKRLVFLTNNFALSAKTIAALYKKRWQQRWVRR
jgi:IS4 transposase